MYENKDLKTHIAKMEEAYNRAVADNVVIQRRCEELSDKCKSLADSVAVLTVRINKDSSNSCKLPSIYRRYRFENR